MKKLFTTIVMAAFAVASFAGGLLTNTNQHSAFVRNPARFASLGIDAVYFNPAGTAFLQDGWHLSANWQMIWQQRDAIAVTPQGNKKFNGEVYVPALPTFLAAYKTGDWTFSGFFGVPGGGGKCEFADGLPSFNGLASMAAGGLPGNSEFTSTQYVFALQLGAAYKINDNLSAFAGVRGNYTSANYEGKIGASMPTANGNLPVFGIDLDLDQSGIAFAPIVGIDYKVGNFNFAAKYEFRAITTVENETNTFGLSQMDKTTGQTNNMDLTNPNVLNAAMAASPALGALAGFADGNTLRNDAPAMLSLAGSWQALPRLQVMAGWNYYFDKDAKVESLMGGDNMRKLSRNTFEYLFGAEYQLTDKFLVSAGIQFTNFGINDNYTSDLAFTNDSFMTGVGGKYSLTDKVDINFGYSYANYAPDNCVKNAGTPMETKTRYERKTHNATIGVDFRL